MSSELQEALLVFVQRKMEGIAAMQTAATATTTNAGETSQSDNKKVSEKS